MKLVIKLKGAKPMVQHNGRLANPLDPYTRELKAITGKRNKTDDDLIEIMRIEARGSCYETEDGALGLPNAAVWRCIEEAARAFKRGKDIKRGLHFDDMTVPLHVDGAMVQCDEYLKDPNNIDYRPVVVSSRRTMRARPIIREWESRHEFELLEDVIDARNLVPIFERAGRLVGVCEMRPTYGTFEVEVE